MAKYLVTGAAGFIASKTCELLLSAGHTVVGVDNMNDAYDVRLKEWRLARLTGKPGFTMERLDICDKGGLGGLWKRAGPFDAREPLEERRGITPTVPHDAQQAQRGPRRWGLVGLRCRLRIVGHARRTPRNTKRIALHHVHC